MNALINLRGSNTGDYLIIKGDAFIQASHS